MFIDFIVEYTPKPYSNYKGPSLDPHVPENCWLALSYSANQPPRPDLESGGRHDSTVNRHGQA